MVYKLLTLVGTERWIVDMAALPTIVEVEELKGRGFEFAPVEVIEQVRGQILHMSSAIDEKMNPTVYIFMGRLRNKYSLIILFSIYLNYCNGSASKHLNI